MSKKISIIIRPEIHKNQPRFDIVLDSNELEAIVRDNVISIIYHPGVGNVFKLNDSDFKFLAQKVIKDLISVKYAGQSPSPELMHRVYQILDEYDTNET